MNAWASHRRLPSSTLRGAEPLCGKAAGDCSSRILIAHSTLLYGQALRVRAIQGQVAVKTLAVFVLLSREVCYRIFTRVCRCKDTRHSAVNILGYSAKNLARQRGRGVHERPVHEHKDQATANANGDPPTTWRCRHSRLRRQGGALELDHHGAAHAMHGLAHDARTECTAKADSWRAGRDAPPCGRAPRLVVRRQNRISLESSPGPALRCTF